MELRIYQIVENMPLKYELAHVAARAGELCIEKVKLYDNQNLETMDKNTLYLSIAEDFEQAKLQEMHYIVIGKPKKNWDYKKAISVTFIIEDTDIITALAKLQDIFLYFQQWEADIQKAILTRCSLQEIVDKCATSLQNPIGIFDMQQNLLVRSDYTPGETPADSLSSYVISHGYSPDETGYLEEMEQNLAGGDAPFFFKSHNNEYDSIQRLMGLLHLKGSLFGVLGSVDNVAPHTQGEYYNFCLVLRYINLALEHSEEFYFASSDTPWFISQLLRDKDVNSAVLQYNCRRLHHNAEDNYFVLTFQQRADASIQEFIPNLSYILQNSLIFYYAGQLVVLDYNTQEYGQPILISKVKNLLTQSGLLCGCSMIFRHVKSLHMAFMQTQACLAVMEERNSLCYFSELYPHYITRALNDSNESDGLFYPGLKELMKENPEYGFELVDCLRAYILHGQNLSSTAKVLFIHRHTVLYRIQKIETFLKIELASLSDNDLLLLLLSCIRLQAR